MSAQRAGRPAPLLPREDAREAALYFVVGALCFLAALSGLFARSAWSAADAWTDRVAGEITLRIRGDEADAARALELTLDTPGVVSARALSREDAQALLRPWLGASGVPEDLPLPHLVAAESLPGSRAADALAARLAAAGLDANVDDHAVWSRQMARATDLMGLLALATVLLLGAIAAAVIAFATHAALLARKDIVEVMHLCGARDDYISGLFEHRFLMLGVQSGTLGALLALGVAAALLQLAQQPGAGSWLLPNLSLSLSDGLVLGLTPLAAGLTAMLAARMTVARSLAQMV
jgi:cell division transport system permease protein